MRSYHQGKKLSKFFMGLISIVLCVSLVGANAMTAFAYQPSNASTGLAPLEFKGLDSIASQEICLITFNGLDQTGADSEGRAIIGGNLNIDGGWSASVKMKFSNDYALIVEGDVNATGYLSIGGCAAQTAGKEWPTGWTWDTANCCSHGKGTQDNGWDSRCIHVDYSGWIEKYVSAAEKAFKAAAATYSSLPADGSVRMDGNTAVLSAGSGHKSGDPYVFKIDGNSVSAVRLEGTWSDDALLINVSGSKPRCFGGDDSDTFMQTHAIWNYYEATELSISSNSVQGSLLAPYATFTGSNGHVNGTTIVNKMIGAGGFEYHTGFFFKNPFSAGVTVTKKVEGTPEEGAEKTFRFQLLKSNGTLVKEFTLADGETFRFSDLEENVTYKVVELDSSNLYTFSSATAVGDYSSINGKTVTFTATDGSSRDITYVNSAVELPKKGSISVAKSLNDTEDPSAKFTFTIYDANMNVVNTATLGNGQKATFSDLPYGTYYVSEDVNETVYAVNVTADTNGNVSFNGPRTTVDVSKDYMNTNLTYTNSRQYAKLTVAKSLVANDLNDGTAFGFELQKKGANGYATVEKFALKAGETKTFELAVGANYKVVEVDSGENYNLYSSANDEIYLVSDATASFVNTAKKAGLTIKKQVEGKGNPNDEFSFVLQQLNGSTWNNVATFTLKDGGSKTFTDLFANKQYRVYESNSGSIYALGNITGADSISDGSYALVTLTQDDSREIVFTNNVKPGSLTVKKIVNDSFDGAQKDFAFSVYASSDNGANWTLVDSFTLSNGQTKTESNLSTSYIYKVVEETYNSYSATYSLAGGAQANGSDTGAITLNPGVDTSVVFTNTRKTASLTVKKAIDGTPFSSGDSFTFRLYKKSGSSWVEAGQNDITVKANGTAQFTGLAYGNEYAVAEVSNPEYTFKSVAGGTSTKINGMYAAQVEINGAAELTFTNTPIPKLGGFTITKEVSGFGIGSDKFNFTIEKKNGDNWNKVETITLKAGESKTYTDLTAGDVYRITESSSPDSYALYTVIGAESVVNNTATVTIKDKTSPTVIFTNKVKTGALKVTKTVNDEFANAASSFSFIVYESTDNGATWNQIKTFSLANGKSETIENLDVTKLYKVVEADYSAEYQTTVKVGSAKEVTALDSGKFTLKADETVEALFTNTRKTASISVTKAIDGTAYTGDTFSFQLYTKEGSQWKKVGEPIEVAPGKTGTFENLAYGNTYAVAELNKEEYTFVSVTGGSGVTVENLNAAEVTISGDASLTFTNKPIPRLGGFTISKKLTSGTSTEDFTFVIEKKNGLSWQEYKTVTMKAGETQTIAGLTAGDEYRVYESKTGSVFELDTIEADKVDGKYAYITIEKDKTASAVFYNKVRNGSITVTKSLTDATLSGTSTFTFELQKLVGDTFTKVGDEFTITVANGKSATYTVENLPFNDTYRIVEKGAESYETKVILDGNTTEGKVSEPIVIEGAENVTFENSKQVVLSVAKAIEKGDSDLGKTFTILVQRKEGSNWVDVKTLKLKASDAPVSMTVPTGTYRVLELDGTAGYTYASTTVDGAKSVEEINAAVIDAKSYSGASFVLSDNASAVVTNRTVKGHIMLVKTLSDKVQKDAKFRFTLQQLVNGAWTDVLDANGAAVTVELGHSEAVDLAQVATLEYGASYRVVEDVDSDIYRTIVITNGTETEGAASQPVMIGSDSATISYSNTRRVADLKIVKALTAQSADLGESFEVSIYKHTGNGWKLLTMAEDDVNGTFTIKAGANNAVHVSLPVGVTYRIVETKTGMSYKFESISENVSENNTISLMKDEEVTIVNAIKTGSIQVTKKLTDEVKPDAKFTFTITNEKGDVVASKTMGASEVFNVENLPYGSTYTVTETVNGEIYTTKVTANGKTEEGTSAQVTVGTDKATVAFENVRNKAKLKINKKLAAGSNLIAGESFNFQLYRSTSEGWQKVGEEFSLEIDGSKELEIPVGASYCIVETKTGESYEFDSSDTSAQYAQVVEGTTTYTGIAFNFDTAGKEVNVYNKNGSAKITVAKNVINGSDNGDDFTFVLQQKNGSSFVNVSEVTIKNGEKAVFPANPAYPFYLGNEYRIVEKNLGTRYVLDSIIGADDNDLNSLTASLKLTGSREVTFVNSVKQGKLTVKKLVNDSFNKDAAFTVKAVNADTGAVLGSKSLKNGETLEINNLPYGTKVKVTEEYNSDIYTASAAGIDADGVIVIGSEANNVTFTNTRKTGTLKVTKSVNAGSALGKSFGFELDVLSNDGKWTKVESFTLKDAQEKVFTDLSIGAQYRIIETDTTDAYTYANASVGELVITDDGASKGTKITLTKDTDVVMYNTLKTASLTIGKTIALGGEWEPGESFTFLIEKFENGAWKQFKTVNLTYDERVWTSEELNVGDKYRVTETTIGYRYEIADIDGADKVDLNAKAGETSIVPTGNKLIFTNEVKTGVVKVTKKLNDAFEPGTKFAFTATNVTTGEVIGSFELGANQTWTSDALPYGTIVSISEQDNANYTITADGLDKDQVKIDADTKNVTFTNTRKTGSLTVKKLLAQGSNNLGETFSFELQANKADKWEKVEAFTLKANETYKIDNLFVGASYRLVETKTGASYNYVSTSTGTALTDANGAQFVFTGNTTANVTNAIKEASLIVNKSVIGSAHGDEFTFTLEKKDGAKWVAAGEFALSEKNNYTYKLDKVSVGDVYRITETNLGSRYELSAITGADTKSLADKTATVTIVNDGNKVTFENCVKLGDIIVKKSLVDTFDSGAKFSFTAKNLTTGESLGSKELGNNETWKIENVEYGDVVEITETVDGEIYTTKVAGLEEGKLTVAAPSANVVFTNTRNTGSLTVKKAVNAGADLGKTFKFVLEVEKNGEWTNVESFELKADETKTFTGLFVGANYRVTETDTTDAFSFESAIGGAEKDQTVTFTAKAENSVTVNNKLNTAGLKITKTIAAGGDWVEGEKFTFEIEKKVNGKWEKLDTVTVDYNNRTAEVKDVFVGDAYRVTETEIGYRYELKDIKGADDVDLTAKSAEILVPASGSELIFVNEVKKGDLVLTKSLIDSINPDAQFAFTLYKFNAETKDYDFVDSFSMGDKGSKQFTGLNYGDTYKVVEEATGTLYNTTTTIGDGAAVRSNEAIVTISNPKTEVKFENPRATAKLTVDKELFNGATDEKFSFVIEKKLADATWKEVAKFELADKDAVKAFDLEIDTDYRITETVADGSQFCFKTAEGADNGYANGSSYYFTLTGNTDVKVINQLKSASLTVRKQAANAKDDVFKFTLYKLEGGKMLPQEDFELKAGETRDFNELLYGDTYCVKETDTGANFNLKDISGADDVKLDEGYGVVTIDGAEALTFTNEIKQGKITVTKKLNDKSNPAAKFTFNVYRDGSDNIIDTFVLGNGETYVIESNESYQVNYGDKFVIKELSSTSYDTVITIDGTKAADAIVEVASDDSNVVFTNTRKTAKLTVAKAIKAGDSVLNDTFSLTLEQKLNNEWKTVDNGEFKLSISKDAPTAYKEFANLDVNAEYRIIETETGANYVFDSITNATKITEKDGGTLTLTGDTTVTVTNKVKTGILTVTKALVDGYTPGAKFAFTATNADTGEVIKSFSLGDTETAKVGPLPYGTNVKIVEASDSDFTVTTDGLNAKGVATIKADNADVKFTNTRKLASITVKKLLKNGGKELDKEFKFNLEILKDGKWAFVKSFTLKADESTKIDGLFVGATYRVIETDTTSSFKYAGASEGTLITDENGKKGTKFELEGNMNVNITNELESASLTVTKDVENAGEWLDTEAFSFTIEKKNANGTYDKVQDVTLTKKNKTYTLDNVIVSDVYRITETTDNYRYYLKNVTGADKNGVDLKNKSADVTIVPSGSSVNFTNDVYEGKVTVTKAWDDTYAPAREFTFNAYKNGAETPFKTFTLSNGTSETFTGKYGDTFKFVEVGGDEFSTVVTTDDTAKAVTIDGLTANVALKQAQVGVLFTNTRNTADITVKKALAAGSKDLGETFKFELFEKKGNTWNSIGTCELTNGKSYTFKDMNVGVDYKVVETATGASYNFNSASAVGSALTLLSDENGGQFKLADDTIVTITNVIKEANLTISKAVVGADYGDIFSFHIEKSDDANVAKDITLASGNNYTWTAKKIGDTPIHAGDTFVVTETSTGAKWTLTGIEVNGTALDDITKGATVTVPATGAAVKFTNTAKVGEIIITKTLSDALDTGAKFTFSAKNLTTGEDYGTKALGNGETWSIKDVEFGDKVLVSEAVDGTLYTTTVNGAAGTNTTVTVAEGANKVDVKNVRKLSGLVVTKKLDNNRGADLNTSFKFALQIEKNGKWENVKTFDLKAGDVWSSSDLFVGADYRVIETDTTEAFSFKGVNGGTTLTLDKGAEFVLSSNDKVEFTNKLNNATLAIEKEVTGGNAGNDSFTFKLEKKVGDKFVDQNEEIILNKSNGFKWSKTDAIVGEVYRITETNIDSKYQLTAVAGTDEENIDLAKANATVVIGAMGETITFTNAVKTGEIKVTKTLNDIVDPDACFTFTLYKLESGIEKEVKTFTLGNGETWSSKDAELIVRYGDSYIVRETCDAKTYETTITVNEKASGADDAFVVVGDTTDVQFTNTRKTTDFELTKTVSGVTEQDEYYEIHMTGLFENSNGKEETKKFIFTKSGKPVDEKVEGNVYAKIGDTVKVNGVLYGAPYTIEEVSAEYYSCYINEVATDKSVVTTDVTTTGDISNVRKTADLTLTKVISRGKDLGDTFKFQLYMLVDDEWKICGEEVSLKANESFTFEDIPVGLYYKIIETDTGENYIFGKGDENTTLVSSENEKGVKFFFSEDRDVTISNPIKTDSITVRKQIIGEGGEANTQFGFELQQLKNGKWETIETFKLKANDYKTFEELDLGESYKVVETDTGACFEFVDAVIDNKGANDKVDANEKSATVVLDGAEDITFSNTPVKQKLTVKKALAAGSADLGQTFSFELFKKVGNNWVSEKTFTLKAGETVDLEVTNGVEYKVVETDTGDTYRLCGIEGGDTVELSQAAATVKATGDREITFTNEILVGSLTLHKTTSGLTSNKNTYTYKITDDKGMALNNPALSGGQITVTAGSSVTLNDIPYGTKVVITELADENEFKVSYTISGMGNAGSGVKTPEILINKDLTVVNYVNQTINNNMVLGAEDGTVPPTPTAVRTTGTVITGTTGNGYNVGRVSDSTYTIFSDVLGDTDATAPQTGDQFPFAIVVLMAVSGLMVLVLSKKRRSIA